MSWMNELVKTYDDNAAFAGSYNVQGKRFVLPPIGHMVQNAQIEVTVDAAGKLCRAETIIKEEQPTLIPCTLDSASRTSKPAPHPLHDNLHYIARDFDQYSKKTSKKDEKPYTLYLKLLESWVTSPYTHPKIQAVYKYISEHDLINDLLEQKILYKDDTGNIMQKWPYKDLEKPPIFQVVPGDILKAFVRFRVLIEGDTEPDLWKDMGLQRLYIKFSNEYLMNKKDICFVTGRSMFCAEKHNKGIRFPGDGAKLISSNDNAGFTFRGRFETGAECVTVGYETSQKAMNTLNWLIRNQGSNINGRIFLAWGRKELPQIFTDTERLLSRRKYSGTQKYSDTMKGFAEKLNAELAGYKSELPEVERVNIMVLDAATPGRLSICLYYEMAQNDFIQRIQEWHIAGAWRQNKYDSETKKRMRYIGVPLPKQLVQASYGDNTSESKMKMSVERLFFCIIQGKIIPLDMMRSAVNRVLKRSVMAVSDEYYNWQQLIQAACTMIRNRSWYESKNKTTGSDNIEIERTGYTMALDTENRDRSYLYGRLLAVADKIERSTFEKNNERLTNALKYMSAFAENPFKIWKTIRMKLIPYQEKALRYNKRDIRLLHEIADLFDPNEFAANEPLNSKFLLGFDCQSYVFDKEREANILAKQQKNAQSSNINIVKGENDNGDINK
ncbi:type I-C CRISPR-associated protein Cas8c/Csd1 [Pectinatus haikarae]|uniref:CRISPR-associated protein Csd1 n=1 Tax=Pectinatus haikarae TaxID=349096 RepID=A0ABT9Y9G9_9FIRM|nr:type I-C CRISPR-associated protein Cas8c/Csd1 [Pectinatus haikarae]MDQ0204452.1 CRISPR-associated protein Csd1 [Pectinatus haikarae]